MDELSSKGDLISVREVYNEVLKNCPQEHLLLWVKKRKSIFVIPNEKEQRLILEMMKHEENRNLIKHNNILKGLPVADPFILAVAKCRNAIVVTKEGMKPGARIPNICRKMDVDCIKLKDFFEKEKIHY